ncbi:MAG TPA: hypothetical protein VI916_07885 [Acidimicrobiia bacterium]|nr:hypothetical protein [Acidimicrobiia bacterium]
MQPPTFTPFGDLAVIYEDDGPFASVYLSAPLDEEHWGRVQARLHDDDVPAALAASIGQAVREVGEGVRTVGVIATADGIVHLEAFDHELDTEIVRWGSLPNLVPLLRLRQHVMPHVVVALGEDGARVVVVDDGPPLLDLDLTSGEATVAAEPPDWSRPRMWRGPAGDGSEVVRAIADTARSAGEVPTAALAAVYVVAGESAIPPAMRGWSRPLSSGAPGGLVRAMDSALEARARELDAGARAWLDAERSADRVVEGAARVVSATAADVVSAVFVAEGVWPSLRAWWGASANEIALRPDRYSPDARAPAPGAPLLDVLVRNALVTSTPLRVVGPSWGLEDGVAACLRT